MTPTTDKKPKLFLCGVGLQGVLLCQRHAQAFEQAMNSAETTHTIYELDDEDQEDLICQACDLTDTLEKPRFIIPN